MNNKEKLQYPFFRELVVTPTLQFLLDMVSVAENEIIIVSPWIKQKTLLHLIDASKRNQNINWKVLTRGNHDDFCNGLSDIEAFKQMVENKSFDLRSRRQLHAKVYIVDGNLSLVTSANLTENGMRLNPEVGIASQDPDKVSKLIEELGKWYDDAISLDREWLKEEQKKLLEFSKNQPVQPPVERANYHNLEEDNGRSDGGKYLRLPLPEVWKPLLDSLKESETPNQLDYLVVEDLAQAVIDFLEYITTIQNGERLRNYLVNWFVHKRTLETIRDDKITKERVSQLIGKRKDIPENIWNSEEGRKLIRQASLFLKNSIEKNDLRVSDRLSSAQWQPLGLSNLEICQFVCGMIENKIISGNFYMDVTPTNQLLICNKEIYSTLRELDHIFHDDYREFMDFEKFCQLGELQIVDNVWFSPSLEVFENLYLANNGKIGCRNWNIEKSMEALAWELAEMLGHYYWHYSEMCEALKYLFPSRFGETDIRYVNTRLSSLRDRFQNAGSKGIWQLAELGDGHQNNKEAIKSIFREAGTPLEYQEVIKLLEEKRRCVSEKSIYALLLREKKEFKNLGKGIFQLTQNVE